MCIFYCTLLLYINNLNLYEKFLFIFVSVVYLSVVGAYSQIIGENQLISFSLDINLNDVPSLVMYKVKEAELDTKQNDVQKPFKFGYAIGVDINLKKEVSKNTVELFVNLGCMNLFQNFVHFLCKFYHTFFACV